MLNKNYFNWSVSKTQELPINSLKLWEIISQRSNLEFFHPFCEKNPITSWDNTKHKDEVHYYNGLIFKRNIIKWMDGDGYDLLIGKNNGAKSFVSWRIIKNEVGSILSITIYPYLFNKNLKLINYIPFYIIVKPSLTLYLNSIMKGILFYIKTGQKVEKNQFGNHIWFSKK